MGENSLVGWTAIQVEDNNGQGYRILWRNDDGRYADWVLNDQGARISGRPITNVVDVEVFYGVDLNNDGTIGHFTTTVENDGATTLASSTRGVYLIDGSTEVTWRGDQIGPDSLPGWSAIQVESNGPGYLLLLQHEDGRYAEWTLDDQGVRVSGQPITNVVDVEVFYGVDLNNDGTIGHFTTTVENDGATTLASSTRGVYLIDGSTEVTWRGDQIGPDSLPGWSAIQVESNGPGYLLLLQHEDGRYAEWTLDDQGVRVSGQPITNVVDVEVFYGADLNNDGTIGHFTTTVENDGATTLASSTRGVYLIDGSTEVTWRGDQIGPDSLPGWSAIQVESNGPGYLLLLQHEDGRYAEWTLDDQGVRVSGQPITNVVDVEVFYGVDLNNDGTIGHFTTTVENDGATTLASSTRGVYLIDGSTEVTWRGDQIGPDSLPGWSAIQVESNGPGYLLLLQHEDGRYAEWTLDDQGVRVSGQPITNVVDVEVFYGVDLNNDGTIGHFTTTVENDGATTLASSTRGVYLIDGSTEVTWRGDQIGPDSLPGWSAIQVESNGPGYLLLLQHEDGRYAEWTLDDQGVRVSGQPITNVVDVEVFYGADLNNDGTIGHFTTTVENDGATTLASSTRGVYLIDGSTEVTWRGDQIGPDSLPGWSAIQVESNGPGYLLLLQHEDGRYAEWTLDDQGVRVSGQPITNVVDVEVFYGADLDGSGFIGLAPKVAQQKMAQLAPISDSLSDEPEFDFVPLDTNHAAEGEELLANDFNRSERMGLEGTSEPVSIDTVDSYGDLGIASILEDDVFLL